MSEDRGNGEWAESSSLAINILGYFDEEEDAWVALALEMDLRGYGEDFDEAIEDLKSHILMQIGFALFKGQPELILRPADPVWWERFADARQAYFASITRWGFDEAAPSAETFRAGGLRLAPPHVIAALEDQFYAADA